MGNRAARYDRTDILKALLSTMLDGNVNLQDSRGRTALHEAARVGARSSAMTLVMNGASLTIRDNTGLTPLDYAQQEGHQNVLSGIDMAIRLPQSKLNSPGYMHSSEDDFPAVVTNTADDQKDTNISAIIGIVLGILLGATAALIITVGFRRYGLCAKGNSAVLAVPTHDLPVKPPPARELYKDAFDDLECLGNDYSDDHGATPKKTRGPVVIQVPGHPLSPQSRSKPMQNIDAMSLSTDNSRSQLRNASLDARGFRADAPAPPMIPEALALGMPKEDSSRAWQTQTFSYKRDRSISQVALREMIQENASAASGSSPSQVLRTHRQILRMGSTPVDSTKDKQFLY